MDLVAYSNYGLVLSYCPHFQLVALPLPLIGNDKLQCLSHQAFVSVIFVFSFLAV